MWNPKFTGIFTFSSIYFNTIYIYIYTYVINTTIYIRALKGSSIEKIIYVYITRLCMKDHSISYHELIMYYVKNDIYIYIYRKHIMYEMAGIENGHGDKVTRAMCVYIYIY